jgi:lipopolysaccharide export system permease protein
MIYKPTLYNYVFREICSIFLVSLLIVIFVILATRMMGITEMIISHRVKAGQIFSIFFSLLPQAFLFALPPACLMCILLTFLRLSSDNEIIALHASGVSLYQILPPVFFFLFLIYIVSSMVTMYWVPWGNRYYKDILMQLAESKSTLMLKERIFVEPFDGIVFYVNGISGKDRILEDLFVVDRRDPLLTYTIIAQKGAVTSEPESRSIVIHFIDGTIFMVDKDHKSTRTIKFDKYDLIIDLKEIFSSLNSRGKTDKEMDVRELYDHLRQTPVYNEDYNKIGIRYYEMFSIPLAVAFLGLIGAPLGAQVRSGRLMKGIVISLGVYLFYYTCLETMRYVCEKGLVPPSLGVWIPNVLLFGIGLVLLIRGGHDRPILPLRWRLFGIDKTFR